MAWAVKLLALYLVIIAADGVQRFIEMPQYTEVNPGEDAILTCRISDKKGLCSWQKDNKPVGIYKGKYEWFNENSRDNGECSLLVRSASLQLDDGQWQCQVTASNYDVQDALSSPPAAFAVRVPPQPPRLLFNNSLVTPGVKITVQVGARATVVCESRYGNPPAYIAWHLEHEVLNPWSQTNTSEVDRHRLWQARSALELVATRSSHGKALSCRAHHPSYPPPFYTEAYARLDIIFPPEVTIVGGDPSSLAELVEGKSTLSLECRADGNPNPHIWWTKDGRVLSTREGKLIIAPVFKNSSGIYGCQARNSLGTSDTVTIEIDVKYPPRIKWVGPETVIKAALYSPVTLECAADGNPKPDIRWYFSSLDPAHNSGTVHDGYPVSDDPRLTLLNVSYSQHGMYSCLATNTIGKEQRQQHSEHIMLNVVGKPVGPASSVTTAWSGEEVHLSVVVCADPKPTRAAWLWGSLHLEVPSQHGRFRALEAEVTKHGCYRYVLLITSASTADNRIYTLQVQNEKGYSSHTVTLTVHAPTEEPKKESPFSLTETAHLVPVIAVAVLLTVLAILVLCLVLWCRRKRTLERAEYHNNDMDSVKSALPADAVYAGSPSRAGPLPGSPGAPMAPPTSPVGSLGPSGRYSPAALQGTCTLSHAKETVYSVLEPHVHYDVTISKLGEPPKHLSLSTPLTHQRADDTFDRQHITNEINNNHQQNRFSTFKSVPHHSQNARKSVRNDRKINTFESNHVSKTNVDIEYFTDPLFGMAQGNDNDNNRNKEYRGSKTYSRMYDRNNSCRNSARKVSKDGRDVRRMSNRSRHKGESRDRDVYNNIGNEVEKEKERCCEEIEDSKGIGKAHRYKLEDDKPRPGKVKEIASRFNRRSDSHGQSVKVRPKPLQSYGNQAYLDHVFPDAVEV